MNHVLWLIMWLVALESVNSSIGQSVNSRIGQSAIWFMLLHQAFYPRQLALTITIQSLTFIVGMLFDASSGNVTGLSLALCSCRETAESSRVSTSLKTFS
jgi:hypothetical protein